MKDIIINSEERFIGKHKDHRISIIKVDKMFDMDIQDKTNMNIMEALMFFENMEKAKEFCSGYIDRNE